MPNLRGASPVGRGEGGRRARQRCRTPDESAREHGVAIGAGRGEDASWRARRVAANTGRREVAVGASSEQSGPVQGDPDRSGPVWVVLGRSGPWWTGLGWPEPVWAGLGRSGPVRTGRGGLGWPGPGGPARSGVALVGWTGQTGSGWTALVGGTGLADLVWAVR